MTGIKLIKSILEPEPIFFSSCDRIKFRHGSELAGQSLKNSKIRLVKKNAQ